MGFTNLRAGLFGAVALAMAGTVAGAQESTNQVAAKTDWSVFEETNPRECWAVTTYKDSVNTKDGRVVAVTRGEISTQGGLHQNRHVEHDPVVPGAGRSDQPFVELGIDGGALWSDPVDDGHNERAWKKNRRTEYR